jgi:hypothetical protein
MPKRIEVESKLPTSESPAQRRMLRPRQAAVYCGVSKSFLDKARCSGEGPVFHKPSRNVVVYDPADLDGWLAQWRRRSTSDGPY